MTTTLSVHITKADLMGGSPADRCGCAVALAFNRVDGIRCAHIFTTHAYLEMTNGEALTVALPAETQKLVKKYDGITLPERKGLDPRNNFKPVSFDVDMTPIDFDPINAPVKPVDDALPKKTAKNNTIKGTTPTATAAPPTELPALTLF
jgi:hypothetical protein